MSLELPNGKEVEIGKEGLIVGRPFDSYEVVLYSREGGELLRTGIKDDYVSRFYPSMGKFGSACFFKHEGEICLVVPPNATHPVKVYFKDGREITLSFSGRILHLYTDAEIIIGKYTYKFKRPPYPNQTSLPLFPVLTLIWPSTESEKSYGYQMSKRY